MPRMNLSTAALGAAALVLLAAPLPAAAGMNVEIRSEMVFELDYQTVGISPPASFSPWVPVAGYGSATFYNGWSSSELSLTIRHSGTIVCYGIISVVRESDGAQCSAALSKRYAVGVTAGMACVTEFQNGGADCGITVRVLFP